MKILIEETTVKQWKEAIIDTYEYPRHSDYQMLHASIASAEAAITSMQSHLEAAEKVEPEGWQLVPKEPICGKNYEEGLWSRRNYEAWYEDQLAEAPTPPANSAPTSRPPEIKPHQIAQLVNTLRDIAVKYHDHQSLRERLSGPVHDLWKSAPAPDMQDEARELVERLRHNGIKHPQQLISWREEAADLIEKLAGLK